jgi:Tol biopolymer transport system component
MTLADGAHLGPYEILGPIGGGGMGEVYRARDTRLDRLVAIKVIAPALLGANTRERFEREARAIATLSHPHICTLYDVGSADGVEYLVMEYLNGETLAARLARQGPRNPLPLDETLRIATELADALTAAHRAGVVHRDLKPANVMLTRTGATRGAPMVKVLDFGLAKFRAQPVSTGAQTTTAPPVTGVGTFVGTLAYISPEQLEGRETDARADLFSFGAVLYEMASGKRAFPGDSQASLIAAILDRDPEPLSGVHPIVPPGLDRLVRKCLAKNPDTRWQSASDVADELRWIAAGSGSGQAAGLLTPKTPRRAKRWAAIGIILLLAAGGAGLWRWVGGRRPAALDVRHQQVTFTGDVSEAALSPDGRTIAYATGEPETEVRVLVRDLAGGQALPIWTGRFVSDIAWLPDGTQLAVSGRQERWGIWIVPRLGGSARPVAAGGPMIAASPDGAAIALTWQNTQGFNVLGLKEGNIQRVQMNGFRWTAAIDWHARTNRIVLLSADDDANATIWSVAPDGQAQTALYMGKDPIRGICASPVSDAVYALRERSGATELVRVPMRAGAADSATVLLSGLPLGAGQAMAVRCTISADGGRLLYGRSARLANLWRLDIERAGSEPRALTKGTLMLDLPDISPDGQWIAATEGTESDPHLVRIPIGGGEPVRLTEGFGPAWSPNGRRLAFVSRRTGSPRVWVASADGVQPTEVKDSPVGNPLLTWLSDWRLAWPTPDNRNYRIRDLRTGNDEYLVKDATVGWVFQPVFSPQGDQIAVEWNRMMDIDDGLWIVSWPARDERRLATSMSPIGWSVDAEWVYAFMHGRPDVFRVSVRTGKPERIGSFPTALQPGSECDLTADRAAIVCGLSEVKADAWIMYDFDPAIR